MTDKKFSHQTPLVFQFSFEFYSVFPVKTHPHYFFCNKQRNTVHVFALLLSDTFSSQSQFANLLLKSVLGGTCPLFPNVLPLAAFSSTKSQPAVRLPSLKYSTAQNHHTETAAAGAALCSDGHVLLRLHVLQLHSTATYLISALFPYIRLSINSHDVRIKCGGEMCRGAHVSLQRARVGLYEKKTSVLKP